MNNPILVPSPVQSATLAGANNAPQVPPNLTLNEITVPNIVNTRKREAEPYKRNVRQCSTAQVSDSSSSDTFHIGVNAVAACASIPALANAAALQTSIDNLTTEVRSGFARLEFNLARAHNASAVAPEHVVLPPTVVPTAAQQAANVAAGRPAIPGPPAGAPVTVGDFVDMVTANNAAPVAALEAYYGLANQGQMTTRVSRIRRAYGMRI